ncbi:MAG: Wzz/FepE/Etk N-terminal domain-containing protein [Lachnospiraceae bacterium]|nr:Wzz/FepE/Etk N-terminal domain-containing protein [Lachnospiraceae bacterium]
MEDLEIKKQDEEGEVIDLVAAARILLHRWWLILLVMVVVGAAAYAGSSFLIEPSYCSGFTAYINNNKEQLTESVSSQDITAARSLVSTYGTIIQSRSVVEEAIERARADCTYEDLEGAVTVQAVDDTEIIQVDVVTKNAGLSYDIARALQKVASKKIFEITEAGSMSVINSARYPEGIYSPDYRKIALISALAAGLMVCAALLLREWMDDRVKGADGLEEIYGIPVLGVIHDLASAGYRNGAYGYGKKE